MMYKKFFFVLAIASTSVCATSDQQLQKEINQLERQTQKMQSQLQTLQKKLTANESSKKSHRSTKPVQEAKAPLHKRFHSSHITVHAPELHPESIGFYPTALVADNRVVTYIAGTPVVSSPYLGDRPAFDGSDYIVNISSINRDIRLMQQRRRLYRAYKNIGYPIPEMPIVAISGKVEPEGVINNPFRDNFDGDFTLGSSELDVAAALNRDVEAYIAIAYDASPPDVGPRINNSAFNLNMGFINIGDLDKTPFYFTAGQLFVPFGRFSSSMISAPLTMVLARTKTRPFILGYKSQEDTGPFASLYVYKSDTTLGRSGVGGANLGYIFQTPQITGELGASYISSMDDAAGMQETASYMGTTFGGFGSFTNGNENVRKTQAAGVHGNIGFDRYNLTAEWVGAAERFRPEDLSFNGLGARPQAAQTEFGATFRAFNRPASIGLGYQWSKNALAINLPQKRYTGVFNISIWKDTVESIEYKHDIDYSLDTFANGAAPMGQTNLSTLGTGRSADTLSVQIGVYF